MQEIVNRQTKELDSIFMESFFVPWEGFQGVFYMALSQVLGCVFLNHAPLLDLGQFLYLMSFIMISGVANKPSSAHL